MKKTLATKDTMSADQSNLDSKIASAPRINIAIETDDGNLQPPEIDEIEEVFRKDEDTKATTPDCDGELLGLVTAIILFVAY